ncbi:hypothetical protein Q4577_17410 [Marinovum sp. 2_MG-2023]|nr:hypothetical protein [Marinovum sp. 2_MG-2023]MDO6781067.1 hypothetical protein [Marinovum sp. 1_MG-2023]
MREINNPPDKTQKYRVQWRRMGFLSIQLTDVCPDLPAGMRAAVTGFG